MKGQFDALRCFDHAPAMFDVWTKEEQLSVSIIWCTTAVSASNDWSERQSQSICFYRAPAYSSVAVSKKSKNRF